MLKKIRSLVSNSNSFVEIYDNALPVEECDIIISEIEKSPQQEGRLKQNNQSVVLPDYKSCVELYDTKFSKGDIIYNIVKHRLIECIEKYRKRYSSLDLLNFWGIDDFYNVQKYNGEDDGYKIWHTEHGNDPAACQRIMVWMFYLNDAKSGTEFGYFPTVNAKKGRCVIWPAGWEYVHKGVTPNKGVKYIVTGWISYA